MKLDIIKNYFNPLSILDIGANKGQFHQLAKLNFPDSYIFSIEANPYCEAYLMQITKNYVIALLSKIEAEQTFYLSKVNPVSTGNSVYRELTPHFSDEKSVAVKIHSTTLDKLFKDQKFDLIKLDTQGSELDIIAGGLSLCKSAKGILIETSVYPYNAGAPLHDEVISFINSIGFFAVEELDVKRKSYIMDNVQVDVLQKDLLFLNKSNT
jgi:FkbM family methyltransferase